jgi:WD40 repeat protein
MALDPAGRTVLFGAQDGSVSAFDLSGARRLGRTFAWNVPNQSCGSPPCVAVNRTSDIMATDQGDGTIAIVSLRTLRTLHTLPARDGSIANAISFLPDGRTLVTGGINGRITFWDVYTDRVIREWRLSEPVWWSAVSRDGRLLAVQKQASNSPDSRVDVLQIPTGRVLQTHFVRYGYAGLEFSRDGRDLVALGCCGPGSTLVAWDTRSTRRLFIRSAGVNATAFDITPDSRLLGVGTADGKILFLDPRTGRQTRAPVQVASGNVGQIAFSPDGRLFAVGSLDKTGTLWDLRSGKRLGNPFPPYPGAIPGVVFEPDGRLLLPLVANAYEWPTDARAWAQFACRAAGRDLTRAEWHDLLPNRPYQPVCRP